MVVRKRRSDAGNPRPATSWRARQRERFPELLEPGGLWHRRVRNKYEILVAVLVERKAIHGSDYVILCPPYWLLAIVGHPQRWQGMCVECWEHAFLEDYRRVW